MMVARGDSRLFRVVFVLVCLVALIYLIAAETYGAEEDCLLALQRFTKLEEATSPKILTGADPFQMKVPNEFQEMIGDGSRKHYSANWFYDLDVTEVRSKLIFEFNTPEQDSSAVFVELLGRLPTILDIPGKKQKEKIEGRPHPVRLSFPQSAYGESIDLNLLTAVFSYLYDKSAPGESFQIGVDDPRLVDAMNQELLHFLNRIQYGADFFRAREEDSENPFGNQYYYDSNQDSVFPSLNAADGRELFLGILPSREHQVMEDLRQIFLKSPLGRSLLASNPGWKIEIKFEHFALGERVNLYAEEADQEGLVPYLFRYKVVIKKSF